MKHLVIYYVCTADYKLFFEDFNTSIKNFYPEFNRTIIIISDGLSEYNNYYDEEYNIHYKVKYIPHYPWPINTLFKMKYINDHKIDCDYAFYFNADLMFNEQILNYKDFFNLELLNVSRHGNCEYYGNDEFDYDNKYYDRGQVENSMSYIPNKYTYVSGAIFGGNAKIFYEMCNDIDTYVEIDLKNRIIPIWHDESYLNKWCYVYKDKISINKLYEYDVHHVNKYPFIYRYEKYHLKHK